MKFEVRKATKDDVDFIVKSIIKSSRSLVKKGLFDLIFNTTNDDELFEYVSMLVTHAMKTYCHYENFVIAFSSAQRVGLLCGYEPRLGTKERLIKVLDDLKIDNINDNIVNVYEKCLGEVDKHTWILDFLVVQNRVDEFEISKALLNKSLLTARLKGYRHAQSAMYTELTEVKMMYKNLNFTQKIENRNEYFEEIFHSSGLTTLELHL